MRACVRACVRVCVCRGRGRRTFGPSTARSRTSRYANDAGAGGGGDDDGGAVTVLVIVLVLVH